MRHAGCGVVIAIALLSTTLAQSVRSEITPQAREVVERYVRVTGGRVARDSVRTIRTRGRVSGLEMTADRTTYAVLPWRTASVFEAGGGLRVLEGFDGTTFWRRGPRGGFTYRAGDFMVYQEGQSYFENQQWLSADQGGGRLEVTGTDTGSAGECTVVEAVPPVGPPRNLWFNARTGLLDREVVTMSGRTASREFSDYRRVGALTWPFRIGFGEGKDDVVMDVDSLFVNQPIDDSRFELPPSDPLARTEWLGTAGHATLQFRFRREHLWLDASFDGHRPAEVMLDTGGSITLLDSAYAATLGLVTKGSALLHVRGSTYTVSLAAVDSIRIQDPLGQGVAIGALVVALLPLDERFHTGSDCVGILGSDLLSRFVAEFDFDHCTMTLRDPGTFAYTGSGTAIPCTPAGAMYAVPMTLDGAPAGRFGVDLGSWATVRLNGRCAREHSPVASTGRPPGIAITEWGLTHRVSRAGRMRVGPYELAGPLVEAWDDAPDASTSRDYGGELGNGFFRRFKVTFDYARRLLYLEPGRAYAEPDRFSHAGVWLALEAGRLVVALVGSGTPGDRAGLRPGDVVTAVDGKTAGSWSPEDLSLLLERGEIGRRVTIEFLRDGVERKVTLMLAVSL
jgi:hypothetical protein